MKTKHEHLVNVIRADKAEKLDRWKSMVAKETAKIKNVLSSAKGMTRGWFIPLELCLPGTRFEVIGAPACRGVLISHTFGASRVLLDSGIDTTISPSCEVFTGALPPPPKVRKSRVSAAQAAVEPPKRRPRIFGYTSVRLIYWLGANGWTFDKVKQLFAAFEVPISDSTIKMTLNSVNVPGWHDPAPVTPEEAKRLEMAVE